MSLGTSCWQDPLIKYPLIQPLNPFDIPVSPNSSLWAIRISWYSQTDPGMESEEKYEKGRGRDVTLSHKAAFGIMDSLSLIFGICLPIFIGNGCPGTWAQHLTTGLEVKVHIRRRWLSNNDLKLLHSVLWQISYGPALVRTLEIKFFWCGLGWCSCKFGRNWASCITRVWIPLKKQPLSHRWVHTWTRHLVTEKFYCTEVLPYTELDSIFLELLLLALWGS